MENILLCLFSLFEIKLETDKIKRLSSKLTVLFLQLEKKSHSMLAINIRQDTLGIYVRYKFPPSPFLHSGWSDACTLI